MKDKPRKQLLEMSNEELWQLFPVILEPHDPTWYEKYKAEKSALLDKIDRLNLVRINHIGSTAVPGLVAKPTIDILLEITSDTDADALIRTIENCGYIHTPQPANPPPHIMFMKGYTIEGFSGQAFHLHVRYAGDWDELYFRDYLAEHPAAALEYGNLKLKLLKVFRRDRDGYTAAKGDFIRETTVKARGLYGRKYDLHQA